jgi:hypothetical protein
MRIIREDENKLEFDVYPTKVFLFSFLFLLVLFALVFISRDSSYERLLSATMFLVIFAHFTLSYLLPIHVVVDRAGNTVSYRDFTLFPTLLVKNPNKPPIYNYNPTKIMTIDSLKRIEFTNNLPEFSNFINWSNNTDTTGKFSFVLDDHTTKDIYTYIFSLYRHKSACLKIASYLKIPYEDKINPGERLL